MSQPMRILLLVLGTAAISFVASLLYSFEGSMIGSLTVIHSGIRGRGDVTQTENNIEVRPTTTLPPVVKPHAILFHAFPNTMINTIDEVKKIINNVKAEEKLTAFPSVQRYWVLQDMFDGVLLNDIIVYLDSIDEKYVVPDIDLVQYSGVKLVVEGFEWDDPLHFIVRVNHKQPPQEELNKRAAAYVKVYKSRLDYIRNSVLVTDYESQARKYGELRNFAASRGAQWLSVVDATQYYTPSALSSILSEMKMNEDRTAYGSFIVPSPAPFTSGLVLRSNLSFTSLVDAISASRLLLKTKPFSLSIVEGPKVKVPTDKVDNDDYVYSLALKLDARVIREVHKFNRDRLFHWDEEILAHDRQSFKEDPSPSNPRYKIFQDLLSCAQDSTKHGPFSVTDKTRLPPSKDIKDYLTIAPYWWPNPSTKDGLPYIRKDGQRVPGSVIFGEGHEQTDSTRLWSLFGNTTCLGLGMYFTDKPEYGTLAARNIKVWFINPETRMNPNMEYAQLIWGRDNNLGPGRGIIETRYMNQLLDIVRLLHRGGFLTDDDMSQLRKWVAELMEWMHTSDGGHFEESGFNNHGTYFDVQASSLAAFTGNIDRLNRYTLLSQTRVIGQVKPDGTLPLELDRETQLHYIMFGLQALHDMARTSGNAGTDLWTVKRKAEVEPLLKMAALNMLPHFTKNWDHVEKDMEDLDRFFPLFFNSILHYPELKSKIVNENYKNVHAYDIKARFDQYSGVPLFWNLGMRIEP